MYTLVRKKSEPQLYSNFFIQKLQGFFFQTRKMFFKRKTPSIIWVQNYMIFFQIRLSRSSCIYSAASSTTTSMKWSVCDVGIDRSEQWSSQRDTKTFGFGIYSMPSGFWALSLPNDRKWEIPISSDLFQLLAIALALPASIHPLCVRRASE